MAEIYSTRFFAQPPGTTQNYAVPQNTTWVLRGITVYNADGSTARSWWVYLVGAPNVYLAGGTIEPDNGSAVATSRAIDLRVVLKPPDVIAVYSGTNVSVSGSGFAFPS